MGKTVDSFWYSGIDGQLDTTARTSSKEKEGQAPRTVSRKQARKKWLEKMAEEARRRGGADEAAAAAVPSMQSEEPPHGTAEVGIPVLTSARMDDSDDGGPGPGGSGIGTVRKDRNKETDGGTKRKRLRKDVEV